MLLTVSGLPGSGTTTIARAAADRLDLEHLDGGTVFRAMAAERGVSLADFAQIAERDDAIDRQLDDRLTERARGGGVLLESRLAGWLVTRAHIPGVRVWVHCEEHERARRVGKRDGLGSVPALEENRVREASERARYISYYGIDLADTSIYDLVLDSTQLGIQELVEQVIGAARSGSPGG